MTEKEMKKLSLLAEVACDYYERRLDQNEIAKRLCLSRTRVSRLLKEAFEKGVVNITVNYRYSEFNRHYELEERFCSRFGLKTARILNNRGRDLACLQQDVGSLAAEYLTGCLKKDLVIGVAWGSALKDIASSLYPAGFPVDVVQLMGSVPGGVPNCTPQAIVSDIAERIQGHADYLNLPLFIEDDYARSQLCSDWNNKKILNKGVFSDLMITGISSITEIGEKESWLGYMTPQMYRELLKKGAVGAVFARFFDANGLEVDSTWNRKCVGIPFCNIRESTDAVCIASSPKKAQAIYSAIRGKLINTLITDGTTATAVLNLL